MTANNSRTRKAKGMGFQREVIDLILSYFPELTENDVRSVPSGVKGSDILLSEYATGMIPYDFECKRAEKLNIESAFTQVEKRTIESGKIPALVFRKNRTTPKVCLHLGDFLYLLHRSTH